MSINRPDLISLGNGTEIHDHYVEKFILCFIFWIILLIWCCLSNTYNTRKIENDPTTLAPAGIFSGVGEARPIKGGLVRGWPRGGFWGAEPPPQTPDFQKFCKKSMKMLQFFKKFSRKFSDFFKSFLKFYRIFGQNLDKNLEMCVCRGSERIYGNLSRKIDGNLQFLDCSNGNFAIFSIF